MTLLTQRAALSEIRAFYEILDKPAGIPSRSAYLVLIWRKGLLSQTLSGVQSEFWHFRLVFEVERKGLGR